MAKKRRKIRRVHHKRAVRRAQAKSQNVVRSSGSRIILAFRNLVLFAVLSLIAYILYGSSSTIMYQNLFYLLSMIFGFVAVAFLIVLLVFIVLRLIRR